MSTKPHNIPVKALDGSVHEVNGGITSNSHPMANASLTQGLPSRPKPPSTGSSTLSAPPPGQLLTGKQEHCKPAKQLSSLSYSYIRRSEA